VIQDTKEEKYFIPLLEESLFEDIQHIAIKLRHEGKKVLV
jgi:hypothetical protein